MGATLDNAKRLRRAVLTYLSQRYTTANLEDLRAAFVAADPGKSELLASSDFQLVMQKCGMYVGDHVFKELCTELDPKETGKVPYRVFLDTLYITKMYLNEMTLYQVLKEEDKERKGGITI